jgi:hypothetical protein
MTDDATFCSAARIYLKGAAPDDEPADVVLSRDDEPVLANFGCGLLETFLVDERRPFHLCAASTSARCRLHACPTP